MDIFRFFKLECVCYFFEIWYKFQDSIVMQKIEAGDQNPCLNGSDNSSDVSKAVLDSRQKFLDSIQVVTSNLVYEFESKFLSF